MPVHGYTEQSTKRVDTVNFNKCIEERLLRHIEQLHKDGIVDVRWASIAMTHFEQGFMALNRSIFKPSRIKLPEDTTNEISKSVEGGQQHDLPSWAKD